MSCPALPRHRQRSANYIWTRWWLPGRPNGRRIDKCNDPFSIVNYPTVGHGAEEGKGRGVILDGPTQGRAASLREGLHDRAGL
jgi:hypothetical protein